MIVYAGVQNTSFAAGRADLSNLARLEISEKQAFLDLPLMEKFAAPVAHAPDLAVVSMDGGRLQIRDRPPDEATEGDGASAAAPATPSTASGYTPSIRKRRPSSS